MIVKEDSDRGYNAVRATLPLGLEAGRMGPQQKNPMAALDAGGQ
jgi:hypothetical protein